MGLLFPIGKPLAAIAIESKIYTFVFHNYHLFQVDKTN